MKSMLSRRISRTIPKLSLFLFCGLLVFVYWNFGPQLLDRPFDRCVQYASVLTLLRCPWPPNNADDLRSYKTGLIDLSLKPIVSRIHTGVNDVIVKERMNWLQTMHSIPLENASLLRKWFEFEYHGRMFDQEASYDLYPQVMNVPEAVKAIREGNSVKQTPINDPTLEVLRLPRSACTGYSSPHLVVVVKTCANCFAERQHARETYMQPKLWSQFRVQFVFVTGLPSSPSAVRLDNSSVTLPPMRKRYGGSDNLTEELDRLFEESTKFRDLLVGNFADTYYNLTLKQMLSFRWISVFCRAPIYLFIDNDYSIIPMSVMTTLAKIPDGFKRRINAGTFGPNRIVLHFEGKGVNQWTVSKDEVPWDSYPPYSSGAAYFVGYELVVDAAIAMSFTRYFRLDDAFLGFVWAKLHEPVYKIPQMVHTIGEQARRTDILSAPKSMLDPLMDWDSGRFLREGKNVPV